MKHSFVQASTTPIAAPNIGQAFGWIGEMRRRERADRLAALREKELQMQMLKNQQQMDLERQRFNLLKQKYDQDKQDKIAALKASLTPLPDITVNPYTTETVQAPDPTKEVVEADKINELYSQGNLPTVQQFMPEKPKDLQDLTDEEKKYAALVPEFQRIDEAYKDDPLKAKLAKVQLIKQKYGGDDMGIGERLGRAALGGLAKYVGQPLLKVPNLTEMMFATPEERLKKEIELSEGDKAIDKFIQGSEINYDDIFNKVSSAAQKKKKLSEYEKLKDQGRKKYETEIVKYLKDSKLVHEGTKPKDIKVPKALTDVYGEIDRKTNAAIAQIANREDLPLQARADIVKELRARAQQEKNTYTANIYKPMAEMSQFKAKEDYKAKVNTDAKFQQLINKMSIDELIDRKKRLRDSQDPMKQKKMKLIDAQIEEKKASTAYKRSKTKK